MPSSIRFSASSILEISLRSRSRVRSSSARSVSSEARSAISGSDRLSSCRCCRVSFEFLEQFDPPAQQLLAEIFELHGVHEGLFFERAIVGRQEWLHYSLDAAGSEGGGGVYEFSRAGQVARHLPALRPSIEMSRNNFGSSESRVTGGPKLDPNDAESAS